jgi:hypothetical protein
MQLHQISAAGAAFLLALYIAPGSLEKSLAFEGTLYGRECSAEEASGALPPFSAGNSASKDENSSEPKTNAAEYPHSLTDMVPSHETGSTDYSSMPATKRKRGAVQEASSKPVIFNIPSEKSGNEEAVYESARNLASFMAFVGAFIGLSIIIRLDIRKKRKR